MTDSKKKATKQPKVSPQNISKLYEIVLAEEKRLRLWLSHIAHDFPDSEFATIAKQALAGKSPPPHPLPYSEPTPE